MDENKLKVLQELPYVIKRTCGTCKFCRPTHSPYGFTTCMKHSYSHLKHSQKLRELSVNVSGCCGDHKWKEDINLGSFSSFKEK